MTDTEENIGSNIGSDYAGVAESKTATQELFHNAFPITIGTATGAVVSIEYFVISTDWNNVQILPNFWRSAGAKALMAS